MDDKFQYNEGFNAHVEITTLQRIPATLTLTAVSSASLNVLTHAILNKRKMKINAWFQGNETKLAYRYNNRTLFIERRLPLN